MVESGATGFNTPHGSVLCLKQACTAGLLLHTIEPSKKLLCMYIMVLSPTDSGHALGIAAEDTA